MAKQPNFARSSVPAPPPGTALPDTGGMPVPKVTMTPWTRQQLEALGWKEGDPIPGDLGKRIAQAVAEHEAKMPDTPLPDAKPGDRAKVGKMVNITDLPAARQNELQQYMQTYAATVAEQTAAAEERRRLEEQFPPTISPGVRDAAIAAQAAAQAQRDANPPGDGPEVTFSRGKTPDFRSRQPSPPETAEEPPEPERPPEATPEDVVAALPEHLRPPEGSQVHAHNIAPFVTGGIPQPPPPQPAAPPAPEEPPEHDHEGEGAGGTAEIARCPRCLWDMSMSFEAEPTAGDRAAFVACILGADRFHKTYAMMDGSMNLTFRSLTASETDLVFQQMRIDGLRGLISSDGEYFSRLNLYRLTMMLDRITDNEGAVIAAVPPIFDIPYDKPETGLVDETRLVPMLEWFNKEVCTTEPMRHLIAQKHREFQRLLEAMEAQTSNPDFWRGIG